MDPPTSSLSGWEQGGGCQRGQALGWSSHLNPLFFCLLWALLPGYAEHVGLTQFRRRFQMLDPLLAKKLMLASEGIDERKVCGAMQEGVGPWVLLFQRGLPQEASGPAGVRGSETKGGQR